MKRKIFSILFALVLACSLGLVTAVPTAVAASQEVTLVATGEGIAEWSAKQHIGDYSIHLAAPGKCDWADYEQTYADALIQIPLKGLTLNDIETMSWWNYLVNGYPPALRIKLDYDGDGDSDYHLVGEFAYQEWLGPEYVYIGPWDPYTHYKPGLEGTDTFYYPTYDTWMRTFHTTDTGMGDPAGERPADTVTTTVHSDTIFWVMVVGGVYGTDWCSCPMTGGVAAASYFATLDDYKTDNVSNMVGEKPLPILGDAKVLMLEFAITNEIGLDVDPPGHDVYFADLTINDEPYPLELPTERPLTVDDDRVENPDAYFQRIQSAIDAASPGDTISVAAGIYVEAVLILGKPLTLQGKSGAVIKPDENTPTYDPYAGAPFVDQRRAGIYIYQVDGVIIDGFEIDGTGTDVHYGIIGKYSDNSTVRNCVVHDIVNEIDPPVSDVGGVGIMFYNEAKAGWSGVHGVLIEHNVVYKTGRMGIFIGGWTSEPPYWLLSSNNVIKDNEVYDTWQGPTKGSGGAVTILGASGSLIQLNEIYNNTGLDQSGISILGWDSDPNRIIENDIYNNYVGIKVSGGVAEVHYNNITGNTYGVKNMGVDMVDATSNWWGDIAGPQHLSNPYFSPVQHTSGDAVSNNVDYMPWLIQTELQEDWNIYSMPITPDEACLEPFMDALLSANVTAAYYFDSDNQSWGIPEDAGPLDAVYLKLENPGTVNIWATSEATFPAQKVMKKGWNLVGLAELYEMPVDAALVSAFWGTGEANLWGYSQVTSPSLNGILWTYMRDGEGSPMVPTKGYWVFMVNDGVLGGFSSTPIREVD